MMDTCARLRLVQRVLIAAAGDIKSINISECGLVDWCLPAPIIARLPHLQELHCMTESEVKDSKLQLPPAQVCSCGIERIKEFFFHPEQKDLEDVALTILSLLDSSSATVAPVVVGIIDALWKQGQEQAPPMVQQLWVSLVSHKNSNEFLPLVEQFLDQHLDRVSDFMKWKDYSGRSAEATATLLCKRAMTSRSYFMGLYDIPDGVQQEYKSATCTVYIVDRVEDDKAVAAAMRPL